MIICVDLLIAEYFFKEMCYIICGGSGIVASVRVNQLRVLS